MKLQYIEKYASELVPSIQVLLHPDFWLATHITKDDLDAIESCALAVSRQSDRSSFPTDDSPNAVAETRRLAKAIKSHALLNCSDFWRALHLSRQDVGSFISVAKKTLAQMEEDKRHASEMKLHELASSNHQKVQRVSRWQARARKPGRRN